MKNFFASLKGIVVFLFLLNVSVGFGQVRQWTWMAGDTTADVIGHYGTKGVASPQNTPGGRSGAAMWTDKAGNVWLFGGLGYTTNLSSFRELNDLWKFDINTSLWTWIKGDSVGNQNGIYGSRGISSALNKPGGREEATAWTDSTGNLWLFGGTGYGSASNISSDLLNDLWKYDIASSEWIWLNGDSTLLQSSIFGTQGVADPQNKPGSMRAGKGWTDNVGNLWMFGGANAGGLDNVWKYTIVSNEWTWMKGNKYSNLPAQYGTKGLPGMSNNPGGRFDFFKWIDNTGNLWIYGSLTGKPGGGGVDYFNDLWMYSPSTNLWTWIDGDSVKNRNPVYGTRGIPSVNNLPGGRGGNICWKDAANNLWLFGGAYAQTPYKMFTDLWRYNITTHEWTWMNADSSSYNRGWYGVKGVSSPYNKPGGRLVSSVANSNVFWVFGGSIYFTSGGFLNDLWKFNPDSSTFPLHLLTFTAKRANTANLLNWTTAQEVNTDHFDIERSPNGIQFSKIGTVKANSSNGKYEYTDNNPTTTPNSKPQTIFYRLKMLDKDGQFTYSPIRQVNINHSTFNIALFPNPAKDNFQLQFNKTLTGKATIKITDVRGKIVLQKTVDVNGAAMSVSTSAMPAGTYLVSLSNNGEEYLQKLVVAK